MKIIIPMTGFGSRFVAAGYKQLKPLIEIQGKPVIQWIVQGMYPGEEDILFVCRKKHLETVDGMRECLMRTAPAARINGEFYADEVIRHVLELGYRTKVFEIDRYLCWGTPTDYENYMDTVHYWERFVRDERCLIDK